MTKKLLFIILSMFIFQQTFAAKKPIKTSLEITSDRYTTNGSNIELPPIRSTRSLPGYLLVKNISRKTLYNVTPSGLAAPFELSALGNSHPEADAGRCGNTLDTGSTCFVRFTFNGDGNIDVNNLLAPGAYTTPLDFSFKAGRKPSKQSITIAAEIKPREAQLELINFSSQIPVSMFLGTLFTQKIGVTNFGDLDVVNPRASIINSNNYRFKGGSYPGTGGDCGSILPILYTCNIIMEVAPTELGPQLGGILMEFDNGNGEPNARASFEMTVEGIARP